MVWFLGSFAYLALHALMYFAVLRQHDTFRRERGIFLYHAVSAVLVTLAVLGQFVLTPTFESLATVCAVVCLHGIYSMSFLEVWSLSQGSYSLRIMRHVDAIGAGVPLDTAMLEEAGVSHRTQRLDGLAALGIAQQHGETLALTAFGSLVASALASIAWLANVRQTSAESPEPSAP